MLLNKSVADLSGSDRNEADEIRCRSILGMIDACRRSATHLNVDDESSRRELLDGLAIAEISIRRMLAQTQSGQGEES